MTDKKVYKAVDKKLDFLLEDHGVDFNGGDLEPESLDMFHKKADAILEAHKLEIPATGNDVAGLQPKLDLLIKGHGASFDDSDLNPNEFDTVMKKLDVLQDEHSK